MYTTHSLQEQCIQINQTARIRAMHASQNFNFSLPQNLPNSTSPATISTPKIFSPLNPPNSAKIYEISMQKNLYTPKMLNDDFQHPQLSVFEERCKVFLTIQKTDFLVQNLPFQDEISLFAKQIFAQFFTLQSPIDFCCNVVLICSVKIAAKHFGVSYYYEYDELLEHFKEDKIDEIITKTEKIVFENCLSAAYFDLKMKKIYLEWEKILDIQKIYTFSIIQSQSQNYFSTPKIENFTPNSSEIEELTDFNLVNEFLAYSLSHYPEIHDLSLQDIQQQLIILNLPSTCSLDHSIVILTVHKTIQQTLSILLNFDIYLTQSNEFLINQAIQITFICILNEQLKYSSRRVSNYTIQQFFTPFTQIFDFNNFNDFSTIESSQQLSLLKNLLQVQISPILTIQSIKSTIYQHSLEIENYFLDHPKPNLFCLQPGSFIFCVKSMNKLINFEIDSERYEELQGMLKGRENDFRKEVWKEIEGIKVKYGVVDGGLFGGGF